MNGVGNSLVISLPLFIYGDEGGREKEMINANVCLPGGMQFDEDDAMKKLKREMMRKMRENDTPSLSEMVERQERKSRKQKEDNRRVFDDQGRQEANEEEQKVESAKESLAEMNSLKEVTKMQ